MSTKLQRMHLNDFALLQCSSFRIWCDFLQGTVTTASDMNGGHCLFCAVVVTRSSYTLYRVLCGISCYFSLYEIATTMFFEFCYRVSDRYLKTQYFSFYTRVDKAVLSIASCIFEGRIF